MNKPGTIKESHLSKQFELKHSKLQKAELGAQLLVSDDDAGSKDHRKFKAVTIHGDGTLDGAGKLRINFPSPVEAATGLEGLSDEDRAKLNSIEQGAEKNPTWLETKKAYEGNADTNAFTDANKNQLDSTHSSY